MRRSQYSMVLLALFISLTLSVTTHSARKSAPEPQAQTHTVMVGAENPHRGVGIHAYFPESVTIHAGDTVRWLQNANEIHTVTFLAGTEPAALIIPAEEAGFPPEPSPLLFNPTAVNQVVPLNGLYDGASYANSGLMGREDGQVQEFSLTFTREGVYDYICLVHGAMMSGQVVVMATDVSIPSPNQQMAGGNKQIAEKLAQVSAVLHAAEADIRSPVRNPDGTTTYYVSIGYAEGQIDLMQFFPDKLNVRPGDTVVWEMSPHNDAPHTVTFLNGEPEPGLVIPVPQLSGPPLLYANPETFFPSASGPVLMREGIYNSGVMEPIPGTTYTLVIGDMHPGPEPFLCLVHDASGMTGTLTILPPKGR